MTIYWLWISYLFICSKSLSFQCQKLYQRLNQESTHSLRVRRTSVWATITPKQVSRAARRRSEAATWCTATEAAAGALCALTSLYCVLAQFSWWTADFWTFTSYSLPTHDSYTQHTYSYLHLHNIVLLLMRNCVLNDNNYSFRIHFIQFTICMPQNSVIVR